MQIRYGSNSIDRGDLDITVGELLSDRSILGAIGAPTDVYATSMGETLESDDIVADFERITLEKRGSHKA